MKIGVAGDSLSLARVIAATIVGGVALAGLGYLIDLVVGPSIAMSGWWTVFAAGGIILGGMIQATREFAVPQPAERQAVAAELRAKRAAEQSETADSEPAADAAETPKPDA
jgi:hypothetical protein